MQGDREWPNPCAQPVQVRRTSYFLFRGDQLALLLRECQHTVTATRILGPWSLSTWGGEGAVHRLSYRCIVLGKSRSEESVYLVSGAAGTPDVPTPPQTRSVSPASTIIPSHHPPHLSLADMPPPTPLGPMCYFLTQLLILLQFPPGNLPMAISCLPSNTPQMPLFDLWGATQ